MLVSAERWQLLSEKPIDNTPTTEPRPHLNEAMIVGHDLADDRRLAAKRVVTHRRQYTVGRMRRNNGDELALIGNVKRIQPEQLASRSYSRFHRQRLLLEKKTNLRSLRQLVERCREPTSGRIAHDAQVGAGSLDHHGHKIV